MRLILYLIQTIGIDSEFCLVESLVTGIVDMWPEKLRYKFYTFYINSYCFHYIFDKRLLKILQHMAFFFTN